VRASDDPDACAAPVPESLLPAVPPRVTAAAVVAAAAVLLVPVDLVLALGAAVVGVLTGTLVTFMVIVRMLDRLRWHERVTIWEPTARLFRSMGHDPYVPQEVIESGRFRPAGRVRVVEYPDPYPHRSTKIIRVMQLDG